MTFDPQELEDLGRTAEEAARAAGKTALGGFRGDMQVRSKGGKDIVTQYDTAAEDAALAVIRRHFPRHDILAEESGASVKDPSAKAVWRWAVDPIDGTHNYAMQLPFWCSSVAVADSASGQVVAAAVYDSLHEELFSAVLGGGAYLNGKKMKVAETPELEDAKVVADIGYEPQVAHRMMSLGPWVQPRVGRLRLLGSAVLAITYVAAGRFDLYYHLSLQPWDIAASSLLVTEAGGVVTGWDGGPIAEGQTSAVVANPTLHPKALAMLREGEARK